MLEVGEVRRDPSRVPGEPDRVLLLLCVALHQLERRVWHPRQEPAQLMPPTVDRYLFQVDGQERHLSLSEARSSRSVASQS